MEPEADCKSASVPPAVAMTPKPSSTLRASDPVSAADEPLSLAYSSGEMRFSRRSLSISTVTFMVPSSVWMWGASREEHYLCLDALPEEASGSDVTVERSDAGQSIAEGGLPIH